MEGKVVVFVIGLAVPPEDLIDGSHSILDELRQYGDPVLHDTFMLDEGQDLHVSAKVVSVP